MAKIKLTVDWDAIKELLNGKRIDMLPPGQVNVTFQRAAKARGVASSQAPSIWDTGTISDRVDEDTE